MLGTVSGFATAVGRPEPAQLELARVYLGYVASAIEQERLLSEVSPAQPHPRVAARDARDAGGPDRVVGGLGVSLLELSRALGAAWSGC